MIARARQAARWFFSETAQSALRFTLGPTSILIGLTWIFGPAARHSSPIFDVWNEVGASWFLTGIWALTSGVLILLPWPTFRITGYLMGFIFRITFAGYALGAYFSNDRTGITGFTDWGALAVLHLVCLVAVVKDREAKTVPTAGDVQAAIERKSPR